MLRKITPLLGLCVGFLNMEIVVIPFILIGFLGLWGHELRIAAVICATLEIIYWYWFSGWLMFNTKRGEKFVFFFKDLFDLSEHQIYPKAKESNIIGTLKGWINSQISKFSPENHEGHWLFEKIKTYASKNKAKGFGKFVLAMLLIAVTAAPLPLFAGFLWIPALVACRSANWHPGLFFLIMGNAVKNYIYASGYILLFS